MEFYEVGGCVRDELLGVNSKDIDFTVVLDPSEVTPRRTKAGKLLERTPFEVMRDELNRRGFNIFVETPKFLTIRAQFPKANGHPALIKRATGNLTADFVLARKEGEYTDGRRPDKVEPGTLEDDLRRRDFTVNALAKDVDGNIIDLFGGRDDLAKRILRTVGDVEDRFGEDYLRALRAVRFAITKGMAFDGAVADALRSEWVAEGLSRVSVERRREELLKAFRVDTFETVKLLHFLGDAFMQACFADGLWLTPSLRNVR